MSFFESLRKCSVETIVCGSVSATVTYAVGALLAGRSIFKMGVLIAAGTNPVLLALAALVGTAAFVVYTTIAQSHKVSDNASVSGGCIAAGIVIYQILSGNIIESLVVYFIAVAVTEFVAVNFNR